MRASTSPPEVELRWYVDESLLGVWKEWGLDRPDVTAPGDLPGTALGMPDPEWIPVVGASGLVVLCRDKRLRTRVSEVRLLVEHGVRVVRMGGKRDASNAEYVERLVRHERAIESLLQRRPTGPWWYSLTEGGLTEQALPEH